MTDVLIRRETLGTDRHRGSIRIRYRKRSEREAWSRP